MCIKFWIVVFDRILNQKYIYIYIFICIINVGIVILTSNCIPSSVHNGLQYKQSVSQSYLVHVKRFLILSANFRDVCFFLSIFHKSVELLFYSCPAVRSDENAVLTNVNPHRPFYHFNRLNIFFTLLLYLLFFLQPLILYLITSLF